MLTNKESHEFLSSSEYANRTRAIVTVLLGRVVDLPSAALLLLITNYGRFLTGDERWTICSTLLLRLATLDPQQLFAFHRACPDPDERPKIIGELVRRRADLKSSELVQLLRLTCPVAEPSREFREALQAIGEQSRDEDQELERAHRSLFGLATPPDDESLFPGSWTPNNCFCDGCRRYGFLGMRFRCTVCPDFDLCKACNKRVNDGHTLRSHTAAHPVQLVHQPLQTFEELSFKDVAASRSAERKWGLEVRFSAKKQAQLADMQADCLRREATPGRTDAVLLLLRDLPHGIGAKIYVSVHPFDADQTHFIGALLPTQPFLRIEWAKLLYNFWRQARQPLIVPTVRLGVRLAPIDVVQEKLRLDVGVLNSVRSYLPPAAAAASQSSVAAASTASDTDVVVCKGEIQRFAITDQTTFRELLEKSINRWDPNRVELSHELQDEQFAVFRPNHRVVDRASGIIRFV